MGDVDHNIEANVCSNSLTRNTFDNDTNKDRILRRGDLARIIGLNGKLNDHHKGDLARVVRSNPITGEKSELKKNGHAFLYDIEKVLGGRLNGVPRSELQYTTAHEEGMTGDSRQRRKRKPTLLQGGNMNTGTTEKNSSTAKKIKKNSCNIKSKTRPSSSSKATSTKNLNNKKRGSKTSGNANGKKKSKNSQCIATTETTKVTTINTNNSSNGIGMFERHRREFERCVLRLQKSDVYNFFSDYDVPPEHDECYKSDSSDKTTSTTMRTTSLETSILNTSVGPSTSLKIPMPSSGEKENDNKKENLVSFPNHPPYNFVVLRKRLEAGRYKIDRLRLVNNEDFQSDGRKFSAKNGNRFRSPSFSIQHPIGIHWELFRDDVIGMCDSAIERNSGNFDDGSSGTLSNTAEKIKTAMEQIYEKTGRRQSKEMELSNDAHRFTKAIEAVENKEAALQGKSWRKKAFPERQYKRLKTDAVCAGLSELDGRIATYELRTSLKDSFLGLSYTYNDTGQSEGWMKTMLSEGDDKNEREKTAMALSSDDGVIKAQVAASMQSLLIAVQDRVMTENGVLEQNELRSANWECGIEKVGEQVISTNHENSDVSKPEIVEQPVWGIDCYTRKNISICLGTKFDHDTVLVFVEKWLLPAINACPVDLAYNLSNAARILEGLPFDIESSLNQRKSTTTAQWSTTFLGRALLNKIKDTAPRWLQCAARILRKAIDSMGHDFFRVHPKGHGSIVLSPKIEPNRLVTFYRGEVYPSWRWGEKMDAISLIQQRNNLKPRLPDFYNMALERPQMDPRGYGLLFVDASRKSGYGSMLSHSCNPSCEVRVAAVNGKLTLAMTTLRELTIGDEVTFDYNAVTESLHEYQAAVCLCGQGQCRGSFLHFATADCYQQVLNRNSPVAVRLSQLIKGCTKKVMSDDDVSILKRHGFQTAAFGAVSVNRRKATKSQIVDESLDSMDFVPIWLRTHIADILRYIEYERRALPIALISNEINHNQDERGSGSVGKRKETNIAVTKDICQPVTATKSIDDKPVKGSKPEPTFFYFLRRKRESFISTLVENNKTGAMSSGEIEREIKKMASAEWKSFDDKMKQLWKERAIAEWEKNGGKKRAHLEQQRLKRLSQSKIGNQPKTVSKAKKAVIPEIRDSSQNDRKPEMKKISFQAADAEGVTAMEQRIQQLTQTLSRVGRVLDRHREELLSKQQQESQANQGKSPAELRELAHSPVIIMPNEHVVAWMWNHDDGIVRTLSRMTEKEVCVSPHIRLALQRIESKYSSLSGFGTPWEEGVHTEFPMSPLKGRQLLDEALEEFRAAFLDGIRDMATEIKNLRASAREVTKKRREKEEKRKEQAEKICKISTLSSVQEIRCGVKFILNDIMDTIEGDYSDAESEEMEIKEPWLNNYNKRFKLEKAADLLLIYRRTSTFFQLLPYESLQSSPIEVYAREVGNSVPRSIIEKKENPEIPLELKLNECAQDADVGDDNDDKVKSLKEPKRTGLCEPEDIISEVVVDYQGDYVLSQLLQWYNAGIDQKSGLPDILGCALLPSMLGCWTIDPTKGSNSATGIRTKYQSNIRPKLVEWFKDPFKRGNPWTDELRRGFVNKDDKISKDASKLWLPIGSPVLDFLVTGDDYNLMDVLLQLGTDSTTVENNQSDGLLSSVDHGRPAQAVSNWVQCENPQCLKWRKIPWHVDIDMLSKKFVCADHIWGLNPPSCDAPEEDWDETTDACVEADGSVKPTDKEVTLPTKKQSSSSASSTSFNSTEFGVGTRFDVLRPVKERWSVANIVDIAANKIKFHFVKTQVKNDIWVEKSSERIAPLHTHTTKPKSKPKSKPKLETKDSQKIWEETSGPDRSKVEESKTDQIHEKTTESFCQSIGSNKERHGHKTSQSEVVEEKFELKTEDEGESDGMNLYDTDEDSDDEIATRDIVNKNAHVVEKVEESPTVTDNSSSDGSLKRDFEPNHTEHSDVENEYAKVADQPDSRSTIPKKSESTKKSSSIVIPKKVIPKKLQCSLSSGTSLISTAARKAMLEKERERKTTNCKKKSLSLDHSPSKHVRQAGRSRIHVDDHNSPSSKRAAFSDSCSLQKSHIRSPTSKTLHPTESSICDKNNRWSISPSKRLLNNRYLIEQRRERELYRDSKEYTARRESFSYEDSTHSHDFYVQSFSPKRSFNDRHSNEQRREREFESDSKEYYSRGENFTHGDSDHKREPSNRSYDDHQDMLRRSPSSDHRRGADKLANRSRGCYSQQDQYETDRNFARDYTRSNNHDNRTRYHERSNDYSSRPASNNRDIEYDQSNDRSQNGRTTNVDDTYDNDYRSFDDYSRRNQEESFMFASRSHENDRSRSTRGLNEREIDRDSHIRQFDNEHKQSSTAYDDNNERYRDDDRYSSRRRRDLGGRREKKRRRKFDGSDEYSRRLCSYNQQGHNYLNEEVER